MNIKSLAKLITIFSLSLGFHYYSFSQTSGNVKNIILLIGDGMGANQVYAAMTVSKDKLNMERAQYCGFSKTYSATNYITDSGAGGTAIATGTKIKNFSVGIDTSGIPLKSILVYAEEYEKSTGIVTTCELTHATPAAFVAHQINREEQNEIAYDFLDQEVDILIGGGQKRFDSLGVSESFKEKGYFVTYDMDSIHFNMNNPVLCLVAPEHPESILGGRDPEYLETAVEIALNKLKKNRKGFFLMVEGSQIDWGGHANNINYVISETIDFDKAVGKAFDFADNNPGTLVIVTADHETGGLSLTDGDLKNHDVQGHFSTIDHSSVMVPVFTYGTGSENFSGIMQNTDLFVKMMHAYGFEQ